MAGTVVITRSTEVGAIQRITATCVGDASTGSFPTKVLPTIEGIIVAVITKPGATNPTASWGLTLVDENGVDRLGGAATARSASAAQEAAVTVPIAVDDSLTFTLSGNSVASANIVIEIVYEASTSRGE